MNLFVLLDYCKTLAPVWTIFGYVIFGIKVVVPLLLIVSGMITMADAVMKKDDKDIKKAQHTLVQKLIAAVLVYLVITIVGIVINLVGANTGWQGCVHCAFDPFDTEYGCKIINLDSVSPES